jgi:hypothetical protein
MRAIVSLVLIVLGIGMVLLTPLIYLAQLMSAHTGRDPTSPLVGLLIAASFLATAFWLRKQ